MLLRLREKLRRASNFGGEKSEWCGRALFYAALNFDHLLSFIIRAQNKRESVFYLREDWFGGQRTFLFFSFRKRNTGHCHGDIDDDAFFETPVSAKEHSQAQWRSEEGGVPGTMRGVEWDGKMCRSVRLRPTYLQER